MDVHARLREVTAEWESCLERDRAHRDEVQALQEAREAAEQALATREADVERWAILADARVAAAQREAAVLRQERDANHDALRDMTDIAEAALAETARLRRGLTSLRDRVREGSEAAPWVVAELAVLLTRGVHSVEGPSGTVASPDPTGHP